MRPRSHSYRGYVIHRVKTGWQVDDGTFASQLRTFATLAEARDAIDYIFEMRSLSANG